MLDDLEAGDDAVAPGRDDGFAHAGDIAVVGEVCPHPGRGSGLDDRARLVKRVLGDVDEHRMTLESVPERARRGDTAAAPEVAPDRGPDHDRRGGRIAEIVLDPDGGPGVADDPLLPLRHGRAAYPAPVTLVMRRSDGPYAVPSPGAPFRLAFVGQSTFFEACALHRRDATLETRFIDYRQGADGGALRGALDA